ncbi:thiol:disulfide interchange protein DsbA/DsbL [Parahaliea mediterranea]|uniref:thiol:disulfide interchange protein DsbA/DsbL n=1 Tax=Parahaliea mediterranea TaxID=651086 RepID=UPI000E2FAC2E|nr:thiol:disulfide interchange protein DsbA/DsbL [Parahaliea mediterranea]
MLKHLVLAFAMVALAPFAANAEDYKEGEHYDLISPPIRTGSGDKVEVAEFFWYGCGHCYNFEPLISQWKKGLGDDVAFIGSPAVWNKPMELHAKAYYTAEVLGVLDTLHPVLFQAMNVDHKRLQSDKEIKELFTANGVSGEDFDKAYGSFGVNSQVRQANSRARAAKITGTPEMMVAGKYRISTRKAGSQANMLKIADFLIEKERAAGGAE